MLGGSKRGALSRCRAFIDDEGGEAMRIVVEE